MGNHHSNSDYDNQVYDTLCVPIQRRNLKARIPISKIDKLRSLLKKNGHRLTSSSNLGRYITLICKQEVERIKKELSLPGQEYMTRDVTMILNGSTRQGEAIAIIDRFIEDG